MPQSDFRYDFGGTESIFNICRAIGGQENDKTVQKLYHFCVRIVLWPILAFYWPLIALEISKMNSAPSKPYVKWFVDIDIIIYLFLLSSTVQSIYFSLWGYKWKKFQFYLIKRNVRVVRLCVWRKFWHISFTVPVWTDLRITVCPGWPCMYIEIDLDFFEHWRQIPSVEMHQ